MRAAVAGLTTYFGRYTVGTVSHTVTHVVEGAMSPDWIGGKLVRMYRFIPLGRIELRVVTRLLPPIASRRAALASPLTRSSNSVKLSTV